MNSIIKSGAQISESPEGEQGCAILTVGTNVGSSDISGNDWEHLTVSSVWQKHSLLHRRALMSVLCCHGDAETGRALLMQLRK
jgi:hypothetical protein